MGCRAFPADVPFLCCPREGVSTAARFAEKVFQNKSLHLAWVEPSVFHEAGAVMRENETRKWSFTDCTSFVIMRQLEVKEAFAFDRNFAEAGFTKLP